MGMARTITRMQVSFLRFQHKPRLGFYSRFNVSFGGSILWVGVELEVVSCPCRKQSNGLPERARRSPSGLQPFSAPGVAARPRAPRPPLAARGLESACASWAGVRARESPRAGWGCDPGWPWRSPPRRGVMPKENPRPIQTRRSSVLHRRMEEARKRGTYRRVSLIRIHFY